MDPVHEAVLEVLQKNKQALVFVMSRASAEKTAEDLAKKTGLRLLGLSAQVGSATKQCKRLAKCVLGGVAFHHAGLKTEQRELVEAAFKRNEIKVICSTPTLAAGINLPAYRVVIKSVKRFSGGWGMNYIPVLEYLQMAGRAGRPQFEDEGEAVLIANDEAQKAELHERYILGEPEEIYSKLAAQPVLRMYVLSLVASRVIRDKKSMESFFSKTFWAHQFDDMGKLNAIIAQVVQDLVAWNFLKTTAAPIGDFVLASAKVQDEKYMVTPVGKRVSELYLDPLTAHNLLDRLERAKGDQELIGFLMMISHTLEMRPLLRVKKKEEMEVQEKLFSISEHLLEDEPHTFTHEYHNFLAALKTSMFFEDWIDEKDEEFMLEKYGVRPGEIRHKVTAAQWLLYSCIELLKVVDRRELIVPLQDLRIRIQHGVRADVLPLLRLKGIGRVRARKLVRAGVKTIGDIKQMDVASLVQILGRALAFDVKKQVGQKVAAPVSKKKRIGQMSLGKYG